MIILQWPRKRGRRLHRLMRDEGNIAAAAQPRRNDGLILLGSTRARRENCPHIIPHPESRHGALRVEPTPLASLGGSLVQLAIEAEFRAAHFCGRDRYEADLLGRSVGRSRSLSKKKPKVNFVDASSCESGMEISAALSRLSISFASQRNESTNNVLFSFPNVPRPDN